MLKLFQYILKLLLKMGQGDYLFYKIAKAKGIKYYALKSVKTANYQTLTDTISEEHNSIKKSFNEYLKGKSIEPKIYNKTNEYLEASFNICIKFK